jgi:hypothetical protein
MIIDSPSTWDAYWTVLADDPTARSPDVDFSREIVLVLVMGLTNTQGWELAILGARELEDRVTVKVEIRAPSPDCPVEAGSENPWTILKVERALYMPRIQTLYSIADCR